VRFQSKWGSEGSGDEEFSQPQGLAIDSEGNVYVSDQGNHRILVFKPTV
jgi:DNA-binding beta-propeller fold protein YncE